MASAWLRALCELYLDFSQAEWDACMSSSIVGDFLGQGGKRDAVLYVWAESRLEDRDVRVKRMREVEVAEDDEPVAVGEEASDADTPAPPRTRMVEEEVVERRSVRVNTVYAKPVPPASSPTGESVSPVVFLVKLIDGALLPPRDGEGDYMAGALEYGVMAGGVGDLLGSMQGVVRHVFTPLLEPQLAGTRGLGGGGGGDGDTRTFVGDDAPGGGDAHSVASSMPFSAAAGGGATSDRPSLRSGRTGGGLVSAHRGGGGSTVITSGLSVSAAATAPALRIAALPTPVLEDRAVAGVNDSVRGEFRSALSRFSTVIAHTLHQVGSGSGGGSSSRLEIPAGVVIADPAAAAHDEGLKALLIDAVEGWTFVITGAIVAPTEREKGPKPLSEVECWRTRSAALTQLAEQAALPAVRSILTVLELAGERVVEPYNLAASGLGKAVSEARDNVKFLATLERHFKTLASGSLASIVESQPSLLNGLRMVWVISRGYATDDAMLPLLKRIASELCERVMGEVGTLKGLFRASVSDPHDVLAALRTAQAALNGWRTHYMATRDRIESSGSENRWEFDRRTLFERADYMALVLGDLVHIVETTQQLSDFFCGNELRALTSEPAKVEAITRTVERLTVPFGRVLYSPWDRTKSSRWRAEVSSFDSKVADIESRTQAFIAHAFQQLRSAEGAFDVLAKFATMPMRDSLRRLLDGNAANIIAKSRAELAEIAALFEANKAAPPLYKNNPPVAGAIAWANALYLRQKHPILRIRAMMPALLDTPEGIELRGEYLTLARTVDAYVKGHFSAWCESVKKSTADLLRQPILGPALLTTPLNARAILAIGTTPGAGGEGSGGAGATGGGGGKGGGLRGGMLTAAAAAAAALAADPTLVAGDTLAALLPPPPYFVNFSPELSALIRECKLLDRMGHSLPEVAIAVALAEAPLNGHVARLSSMLDRYHAMLSNLSPMEANLLQAQLVRLRSSLRAGFSPLNWNSLHIGAFTSEVHRALQDFTSILGQVRKSCSMLDDVSIAIGSTTLISAAAFEGHGTGETEGMGLEVSEVYDALERQRKSTLQGLVARYASVRPIMQQIEGLIVGTDTCASTALAEFYRYWERRFYNAITRMTLSSMATFEALLNTVVLPPGCGVPAARRPPLIRVRAILQAPPEVTLQPDINTVISKYLRKAGTGLIRSAGAFQRWMGGTCLPVDVGPLAPGEAPPDFSFLREVSANPEVVGILMTYQPGVLAVINNVKRFSSFWAGYGSAFGLWSVRRPETERRLVDRAPPAEYFDARLAAFQKLATDVEALPTSRDIGFLRMDCSAVAVGIKVQALKLKGDMGRVLREIAARRLSEIRTRLSESRTALEVKPTDMMSLKGVLSAIAAVQEMRCDLEARIADVRDRYATLGVHGLAPPGEEAGEEALAAEALPGELQSLIDFSLTKDARLVRIKDHFREVTRTDAIAFVTECDALHRTYTETGPSSMGITLTAGALLMVEYRTRMTEMARKRDTLAFAERLFGLPFTPFAQLNAVKEDLERITPLYALYSEQKAVAETNGATAWADLDMATLQRGAEELIKRLVKLRDLKGSVIYGLVADEVGGFKDSLPLISSLKNPAMKERHWDAIGTLTGIKMPPVKALTLGAIFAMNLSSFAAGVEDVCTQAKGELKIEKDLKAIADKWAALNFSLVPYKKNGETRGTLLRPDETLRQFIDDDMMNLGAIAGSRFVPIFTALVSEWDKKLNIVSEAVDVWLAVQTQWAYLEGIFLASEDIRQQLPEETKRFVGIDKDWKVIMASTAKNPNVVDACCEQGRLAMLQALGERLDACQKSLSEYLYTKRNAFPRFFFISDDELLSVLGSSDPNSIQVHLLKLFDNVKAFGVKGLAGGGSAVTTMASSEGEVFELRATPPMEGAVETWMTAAEAEMHSSLHAIAKEGIFKYASTPRLAWIEEVLGMVSVAGSQIWWTWETEDIFRRVRSGDKYAMKSYAERQSKQLLELVSKVRQDIPRLLRNKVNTLLIVDVHARDIIDSFVRDSVLDAREFAWESQLRFYWSKDVDSIVIRQCTGSLVYGYEYMGLNGRLVITPLTDRCYMTLTQALTFNLGGSPAGPAGTGKTETVKDLAKNIALPCFVINCGEGLDYKAMGATFSGLCQVGAWGCFDEFNRINIEVLSVVSAQIRAIQNALNYKRPTADIGMGEIAVSTKVGIFITMNPGYAGRTELPDNLKALFRPVTMMLPDLLQICEISLFSEGFEGARVLAKKMTTLYRLSREQLSKQYHYDFGMRALKSVLVMAGSLKREFSDMPEELVLMRSLRDSNLPKFVYDDVPLFTGLIRDLFPGLDCPRVSYPQLKSAVEAELEKLDMRHDDEPIFQMQVDAVIQLYEVILTRHTTMVVGPTGGGKSVCINTLQRASLPAFDKSIKIFTVNPKAQTVNELYGVMDPITRDWTDGILSNLFRSSNAPLPAGKENEVRWIIFDGDVDAVWIENMNSVMDDNKLLTLPNGERIRLQTYVKLIMEVFDLQYASPATISRCGMTYMDPKNLGFRPYYVRWVKQRCNARGGRATEAGHLNDLFERYVARLIAYVLEGDTGKRNASGQAPPDAIEEPLALALPTTNSLSLVKQLCALLDALLDNSAEQPEHEELEPLEGIFIFALTWSVGALVTGVKDRARFSAFLSTLATEFAAISPLPSGNIVRRGDAAPGPMWYDFFYTLSTRKWAEWSSCVREYAPPAPFEFARILVPTTDSVLFSWLMGKLVAIDKPVLFVGESGTAKTTTVAATLAGLDSDVYNQLNSNFSSRTTARDVQLNIESSTDKRSGKIYGPPVGKRLMVFVDDLNMPRVDKYGTQQPIALLHFLVGRGAMYDRGKDLDLRTYKDLQFVCAMQPPGGGRNPVDPRFLALFSSFCLAPPTPAVLATIYGSIITRYMSVFTPAVQDVASKLTTCTLAFYNSVLEKLPPTPSKFHYIFNLRDLGRVYEGLCNATTDIVTTGPGLVRMWRSECLRIFADRLISAPEVTLVDGLLGDLIRTHFPEAVTEALIDPCLYGDFKYAAGRVTDGKEDARLYADLGSFADVSSVLVTVLEAYNASNKAMTLVLFEYALDHITRLLRILRMPRGNALLVGVGGSGKQSLTRLAAFTAGYGLFEITLVRNYGEAEFREDLKALYKKLAVGPVVFLFTDAHVVEEGFLELINNMLTVGMVPALYEADERDTIVNLMRPEVKARGLVDSKETCWMFFVNKCRANLHLVLAMSPSGDTLRRRCRAFPGLVSASVIDWFFPWPQDALERVASFFLREEALPDDLRAVLTAHCVHVHSSVVIASRRFAEELRRNNYVTPKNYLDFIAAYREQLSVQRRTLAYRIKRLEGGLSKLIEAAASVDALALELKAQKIVVDAKTLDVQTLIADIGSRQAVADRQKAEAQVKAKSLAESSIIIARESSKANTALEAALPALESAAQALDNLNKDDITEIKAFNTPPQLVMNVGLAVMALRPTGKEVEADLWKGAKVMLGDSNFLKALKTYDKDKITERQIKKVREFFVNPDFTMEKMITVSKAGAGLLQWVIAIKEYYVVAKDVEPLRKKVADMERAQALGERELADITALLATLSAEIKELDIKYQAAAAELSELTHRAGVMERRLTAASKLIVGLSSERTRWSADVERLSGQADRAVGDCLLSASFLSYLGPFTFDFRNALLFGDWQKDLLGKAIPLTQPVNIEELLTSDATVQAWNAEGLPTDAHSLWNGILTTRASRFPLCVDPQQQAVAWIKSREGSNLRVATFQDADFMQPLKLAIQYGKPFLFESVDETLDPMVDIVLEKATYQDGSQRMIVIDDKPMVWDDNFRLYLTSKLANPHFSPEVMGKTQIINFCVTQTGLEGQLLNVVVGYERPDLQSAWRLLVEEMAAGALLLEELEESLLRNLATSTGNILDNEELIATLDSAKTKAVEITTKLVQSKATKADIGTARAGYQAAAKRGSILFFVMAGLAGVNKMYEVSLGSFLTVFKRALASAKKGSSFEGRIKSMIGQMTRDMYDYTCMGIFERHKLMFSFQMCLSIIEGEGELCRGELDFFLKGDTSIEGPKEANPHSWMLPSGWKDLFKLGGGLSGSSGNAAFADLLADVRSKAGAPLWRHWYDQEAPETEPLPNGFTGGATPRLSPFQALCILRCFRPDRVYNGVKQFVMGAMGEQYVQPPVLDYARIFASSSPSTPVVFILSPGADPQSDIQSLGVSLGFTSPTKFRFLALGQGQAPKAEEMILQGAARGYWVLLQNTHLLISWLKTLEKMLNSMPKPHADFRLWMTTDPTEAFPLGILQRSLKVVTEPPDGLKLNMRSSYAKLTVAAGAEASAGVEECPHPAYKPLVYVLCFLHAVLLERRKYGKIGFNVSYDFNESDFNISRRALALYLSKAAANGDEGIPWGSLRYLVGEVNYGGRVSDSFDRRILNTYLEEYFGDFLFDANNKFLFSSSGHAYDLPPPGGALDTYVSYVETLPLTNGPAVFGLHPNAEINMFSAAAKSMWADLIDMQPRGGSGSGGGGVSREAFIGGVVRDVAAKIPAPEDILNIRKALTAGGTAAPSPTSVVLLQELERWNKLVTYMAASLSDLARALIGEIGMSEALEELGSALFNGTLPSVWRSLAPATEKPLGAWMAHFAARHKLYTEWIAHGEPLVMWLSGLHIPESYLTALVQVTCRRKGWALDRSTLYTTVTRFKAPEDVPARLEDGCYVRGLFLEGAGWDEARCCLARQDPKALVAELPILQVVPIEAARLQLAGTFRTPVYVTQARRNAMGVGLVVEADLFSHEHPSHWVLQGVALCLNTEA